METDGRRLGPGETTRNRQPRAIGSLLGYSVQSASDGNREAQREEFQAVVGVWGGRGGGRFARGCEGPGHQKPLPVHWRVPVQTAG